MSVRTGNVEDEVGRRDLGQGGKCMESELPEKGVYLALYILGTILYLLYTMNFARSCVVDSQPVRRSGLIKSQLHHMRDRAVDLPRQIFGVAQTGWAGGELSPSLWAVIIPADPATRRFCLARSVASSFLLCSVLPSPDFIAPRPSLVVDVVDTCTCYPPPCSRPGPD